MLPQRDLDFPLPLEAFFGRRAVSPAPRPAFSQDPALRAVVANDRVAAAAWRASRAALAVCMMLPIFRAAVSETAFVVWTAFSEWAGCHP